MKIIGKTRVYREMNSNKVYRIWVEQMWDEDYRVHLFEKYDAHDTEITDLRLNYKKARRYLESYVKDIAANYNLQDVYFGTSCNGSGYYLPQFKEIYGSMPRMKYINDINL